MKQAIALSLAVAIALASVSEDFGKRYAGKLSHSDSGLFWHCNPTDVWQLKSFSLTFAKEFELNCGKSVVALGVYDKNVVWAVVFPEKPARIKAKNLIGDGEETNAICLRFAPSEVARVFPSNTIAGQGEAWQRARACRIFRRKVGYKWYTPSGNPTIVPAGITLVDVDTDKSLRRFYCYDANAGKLEYIADFEQKIVPPLEPMDGKTARQMLDKVWDAFDREYANFITIPQVDWDALGASARKQIGRATTAFDAAAVVSDMLAHLEDLHVWVQCGEDPLPGYSRERALNASWKGSMALIGGETHDTGHNLIWSRSSDGIGYLNVTGLADKELPSEVNNALDALADTWGLVIDLRFNGGGDEDLAQLIAARFVDRERVYSTNRYRAGSKHDSLGPVLERKISPSGPWRYESPVMVLWGQKTMSSAESMALMLAQCPQVTTFGDRTAGSSANPRRLELDGGIVVNLPRWHDMDPTGKPIEHVGIRPSVSIDAASESFTDTADPVLMAALERLRKMPAKERQPGHRR